MPGPGQPAACDTDTEDAGSHSDGEAAGLLAEQSPGIVGQEHCKCAAGGEGGDGRARTVLASLSRVIGFALWDRGVACCVVAATCYSINAVFVKLLHNAPVFEIALARSMTSLPSTLLLLWLGGTHKLWNEPRNILWLLLRGSAGSGAMLFYYVGLQATPLADAQTIFLIYPAIVSVLAFLLLGERMTLLQVLGFAAAMVGLVLVAHPPMLFGGHSDWHSGRSTAVVCLVVAAFLAASAILTIRILASRESSVVMTLWFHICAVMVCAPALLAGWPQPAVFDFEPQEWFYLIFVGVTSFGSQLLFNRGIQLMTGATASCLISLQVPMAYFWGFAIFHEQPTILGSLGTVLAISGLVLQNLSKSSPPETHAQDTRPTPAAAIFGIVRSRSLKLLARLQTTEVPEEVEFVPVYRVNNGAEPMADEETKLSSSDDQRTSADQNGNAERHEFDSVLVEVEVEPAEQADGCRS